MQEEEAELSEDECEDDSALVPPASVHGILRIPKPNDTRWSSMYANMKRIYQLRTALQVYATECKELPGDFNRASYDCIADTVDVLGPVAAIVTALQSSSEPVVVQLLPGVLKLANVFLRNPGATAMLHSGRTED